MPELPEVETIKNELTPFVVGHKISSVTLLWERMLRQPSLKKFYSRIAGKKIVSLARRGKYLIFNLESGEQLLVHLKMSGSLLLARDSSPPPKYTRAVINLDNDTRIFFRDPRKFGTLQLIKGRDGILDKLGPEPLRPEFTPELLSELLGKRKAPIKAALIDQSLIAGIGNMYADEALFLARIHPLRPANSLSSDEIQHLHLAIQEALRKAIGSKGASVANYLRPGGEAGAAQSGFQVAHQGGKPCPVCGTIIQRIPVRQRGSYFCPRCQPETWH